MAISWQTGEPPCGQELLIEFNVLDSSVPRKIIGKLQGPWLESTVHHDPQVVWHVDDLRFLRWSTLDDDRAAMAMGALEAMVREQGSVVSFSVDFAGNEWTIYDENGNDLSEAPTLIEAIKKLTADQQTKGATDEA